MDTIYVEVLNPSSITLLEELEKLQLIAIHRNEKDRDRSSDFMDLVKKLRSKSSNLPSLEEITAEVEQQRAEMYAVSTEENRDSYRY